MRADNIQDLQRFDDALFDTIQEYLDNIDVYPANVV